MNYSTKEKSNISTLSKVEEIIEEFEVKQQLETNRVFDELMKVRLDFNERLRRIGVVRD